MFNKPELFCNIGTTLIVQNDIVLENNITIPVGMECFVENIIGYGFDIKTANSYDIRILNSQMDYYFKVLNEK